MNTLSRIGLAVLFIASMMSPLIAQTSGVQACGTATAEVTLPSSTYNGDFEHDSSAEALAKAKLELANQEFNPCANCAPIYGGEPCRSVLSYTENAQNVYQTAEKDPQSGKWRWVITVGSNVKVIRTCADCSQD